MQPKTSLKQKIVGILTLIITAFISVTAYGYLIFPISYWLKSMPKLDLDTTPFPSIGTYLELVICVACLIGWVSGFILGVVFFYLWIYYCIQDIFEGDDE